MRIDMKTVGFQAEYDNVRLDVAPGPVTPDWVVVGNPGNACDPQALGCYGAVADYYRISKYEVTNAQYAKFLNAVAATDTNGLYNLSMGSGAGGITQSGSSGSYTYSAIAGRANMPVDWVSFYDAIRFANWLHNGQPAGAQDNTTTEDGAYTITALGIANNSITRNGGAKFFLPSLSEWYKAAYYDALTASYFNYPARSSTQTTCASPNTIFNQANCNFANGDLTPIGSYTDSYSPYGTFDQGGNIYEWTDSIHSSVTTRRSLRGGSFTIGATALAKGFDSASDPTDDSPIYGFRVAPEPSKNLLLIAGVLSVFGLAGWAQRAR